MSGLCLKCGAKLEAPFKFCVECGTPVSNNGEEFDPDSLDKLNRIEQSLRIVGCELSCKELSELSGKTIREMSQMETGDLLRFALKEKLDFDLPIESAKNGYSGEQPDDYVSLRQGEVYLFRLDYDKAIDWYKEYIETKGDDSGFIYNVIGNICLYKAGSKDVQSEEYIQEAVSWLNKSVERGCVLGELSMGKVYENGIGLEKNSCEALRYYLRAYKQGGVYADENLNRFLDSELVLVELYENGCRIENVSSFDYSYLAEKYERDADENNPALLLKLGYMYHYGLGRDISLPKARDIYQRIISSGKRNLKEYSYALCFLGDIYSRGSNSIPQNQNTAFDYWRESADEKNHIGLFRMGQAYDHGWGVSEDKNSAIEYYMSSDDANSWCSLGVICKSDNIYNNYVEKIMGRDMHFDDAQFRCFKKSSEMGSMEGSNFYAISYLVGRSEQRWKKEPGKAFAAMKKAAELGNPGTLFCLGEMYESGTGCDADKSMALQCFRYAEKGGNSNASKKIKSLGGVVAVASTSPDSPIDAYQNLQKLIGLKNVKKEVDEVINEAKIIKEMHDKGLPDGRGAYHMVFTGNPGTGKTEVARLVAAIFRGYGILSKGQLVEVDRSKLVASYVGQTTAKTQDVINAAIGGVLFIDEAYSLHKDSANDFGQEAIDTILKEMEDHRDDIVVIVAGYEKPMYDFLHSNPGLESRFRRSIHFDDYNEEELMSIFDKICDDNGYLLNEEVHNRVLQIIKRLVYFKTDTFGNAREIRKLYEDIIRRQRNRLSRSGSDHTKEELLTIQIDDLPEDVSGSKLDIDSIMGELDALIGLDNVKNEIRELADLIQVQKDRRDMGIDSSLPSLHMVFTGNPGTGKTTVARLVSRAYQAMGVLSKGTLMETSRADLVAGYTGQTAIKTKEIIEKSLGGVLFIDEAYSLKQGANDAFGQEAIDTLLKEMEDHRNNLAVIVAGYSNEMRSFIDSNEGLSSRFNRYIEFDDYNVNQLVRIFEAKCESEHYTPTDQLIAELEDYLSSMNLSEFANGRGIRNLFEKILPQQAKRLLAEKKQGKELTKDDYQIINEIDLKRVIHKDDDFDQENL